MKRTQPTVAWRDIGEVFPLYELRDVEYKAEVYPTKNQDGPWTWTILLLDNGPVQNLAIGREYKRLSDCLVAAQVALRDWIIQQKQARYA